MLQIKDIRKEYITGDLKQIALDGVSLSFRDNEFVAVLGPSGSGKTTLLNIVGGLDRYDSGDLIINGVSTKKYKDRDWDAYRNHTIGFVFQSYNLIPHQSILANVELALTISGISRSERRRRAKEALTKVGLGEQIHKRPNQLSGGQMQRVAIARALVNDPDILLADEPTGALDSETSLQVMDMLAEVAKDRLVIMVTHNPELAEKYATRIVRLRDGKITDDSDPFQPDTSGMPEPEHKRMGKASMSKLTALSLSFNNLRTKKGRTLLTAFAGSIGIIGIALILSLSNGVNNYIDDVQRDTMASYPITIESRTIDMAAIMEDDMSMSGIDAGEEKHDSDAVYSDPSDLNERASFRMNIKENNLTAFKKYLDDPDSEIHKYVSKNGIIYSYDTKFGVYTYDDNGMFVNTNGSTLEENYQLTNTSDYGGIVEVTDFGGSDFEEIMSGGDSMISSTVLDNYDVVYGRMPEEYNEIVLVLSKNNSLPTTRLYELGILPTEEYREIMKEIRKNEGVELDSVKLDYEKICGRKYWLIPQCDHFVKNSSGTYDNIVDDPLRIETMLGNALELKIVGVIKPNEDCKSELIGAPMGYTKALTDHIIELTNESEIVKEQNASREKSVITGMTFAPEDDKTRIEDAKNFLRNLGVSDKANIISNVIPSLMMQQEGVDFSAFTGFDQSMLENIDMSSFVGGFDMDEAELAKSLDDSVDELNDNILLSIYDMYISSGTFDDTLSALGVVSYDAPSSINIYADNFENKDGITKCIDDYNKNAEDGDQITYNDYIGLIMSSVTRIVNVISYVLIAFVAVSLIVSSIMIGIITYISVLERTKEIGILRAIGASKKNISTVFNAETFIIGLCAGLIGIIVTLLLLVPVNAVIHGVAGSNDINASLPVGSAVVLILLSIFLTLIGGFIPSKKAAKKDPVAALRSE